MLSENALRRIEQVDRDATETRIRRIYGHWTLGEIDLLIADLAPDVTLPNTGYWTGVQAPLRGYEQVADHLRRTALALESIVVVLHEIVIDGDRAVVHRTAVGRRRESGRRYQSDFIDFFRFRDGLVVEFSQYPDAAWSLAEGAT